MATLCPLDTKDCDLPSMRPIHQIPDGRDGRRVGRGRVRPSLLSELRRTWLVSLIGLLMAIVSLFSMVYNERMAVLRAESLFEAQRQLVVPEMSAVVFEENEHKLVMVRDTLRVSERLQDEMHGISVASVRLERLVHMYQWMEIQSRSQLHHGVHQGDHDGHVEVDYSYDTDWIDTPVDHNKFNIPMGHENPTTWKINSTVMVNEAVHLGGFVLGSEAKALVKWLSVLTSDERPADSGIKMHSGLYYHARDVYKPQVGDLRVQFAQAGKDGEAITVVGKQLKGEIRPFVTNSGHEVLIVRRGEQTVESVFNREHDQNRLQTWLTRAATWLLLFLGLNCNHSPLSLLVSEMPWLRPLVPITAASLPFSFSITLTLLVTGVSWCLFRPLMALLMLFVALVPCITSALRLVIKGMHGGFGRGRRSQLF